MEQGSHDFGIWGLDPRDISSEIPNYGNTAAIPVPAHAEG
jgi:hypothetical protein